MQFRGSPSHVSRAATIIVVVLSLLLVNLATEVGASAATWSGTVTLSSPQTQVTNNDSAVTMSVSWTGGDPTPAGIVVYDENWTRIYYAARGTSGGSLTVKPPANVSHTYTAYVAGTWGSTGPPSGVLASSTPVTITNTGYQGSIDLNASRPIVTADNPGQTLELTAVPGAANPYRLSVYDDTNKRIYLVTSGATSGSLLVSPKVDTTRTYTAYMAQDAPSNSLPSNDVRAISTTTVSNAGYLGTVSLSTDRNQLDDSHTSAQLTVSTSEPVGSGVRTSIYDNLGNLIWTAQNGISYGSKTVTPPANTTRTYTVYIYNGSSSTPPPSSYAVGNSVYVTSIEADDNIAGMSIPVLEAGAAARFATDAEVCLDLGAVVRTNAEIRATAPDVTALCTSGGLRAAIAYLATLIGAGATAGTVWQVVYGGQPETEAPDDPSAPPSAPPTPIPAPIPANAS